MSNGWRSTRLVYKALEDEHKAFIQELGNDWTAFTQAAHFLPVPRGSDLAKSSYEFYQKCLLCAVLCLPAPETVGADSATPSKPIPIGILALSDVSDSKLQRHRGTMIGIQIIGTHQGQGYGSEAIKWALNFSFKHANLHRVSIGAFAYNPGAIKLYERLGFIVEARRRDFVWHDGKYWDCVELAMLEDEWREKYADK